jgi:prevent-host-death family protein
MAEISIRELKAHLTRYLRDLQSGKQITVTRRGKPVAVITSIDEGEPDRVQRKLKELEAQGVLRAGIGKPKALRPRVELRGEGPTLSEMVLEDRGDRLP